MSEFYQASEFLTVADPRMIGLDLTPSEAALLDCLPVVLHGPTHAKLFGLGIHGPAVTGGGLFNALHVEPVCFLPSGRFEFARDMRDQTGHVLAVIIPALDEFGETADLVAWVPDTGVVATQHGAVCILGEEAIDGPDAEMRKTRTAYACSRPPWNGFAPVVAAS